METSWLRQVWQAQAEGAERKDPWKLRLERVRGKIDYDGWSGLRPKVYLMSLRFRSAAVPLALSSSAAVMTELGWTAVRVRGLTPGGYREQVRGYCRDTRNGRRSNS